MSGNFRYVLLSGKIVPQAHCNWFDFLTWVVNSLEKLEV